MFFNTNLNGFLFFDRKRMKNGKNETKNGTDDDENDNEINANDDDCEKMRNVMTVV